MGAFRLLRCTGCMLTILPQRGRLLLERPHSLLHKTAGRRFVQSCPQPLDQRRYIVRLAHKQAGGGHAALQRAFSTIGGAPCVLQVDVGGVPAALGDSCVS